MKRVTNILFLLLLCLPALGQEPSKIEQRADSVNIHFDLNSHVIDLDFGQNRESIEHFSSLIEKLQNDSLSVITKIKINSYASPEGGRTYNKKLSERRSEALYSYFTSTISVPDSLIERENTGIDWEGLQHYVEESDMEHKSEVTHIINSVPEETWRRVNPSDRWLTLTDSRNKHLMDLEQGTPYRYMFKNIFPKLRNGSVVTVYFKIIPQLIVEPEKKVETIEPAQEPVKEEPVKEEPVVEQSQPVVAPLAPIIKPLLAIKSNLLYDAASIINVELEVPIKDRWSIAAEWVFPWWTSCGSNRKGWQKDTKRNTIQLLNGNIEGKYWFGDRSERLVMTGWYAGLYGGSGRYDFERRTDGTQGEFYNVSLTGGYAHTINKSGNLRLEYSLGLGFLQSGYEKYEEHNGIDDHWHTTLKESGTQNWFGPTRARVSLVWMLNRKVNKEK